MSHLQHVLMLKYVIVSPAKLWILIYFHFRIELFFLFQNYKHKYLHIKGVGCLFPNVVLKKKRKGLEVPNKPIIPFCTSSVMWMFQNTQETAPSNTHDRFFSLHIESSGSCFLDANFHKSQLHRYNICPEVGAVPTDDSEMISCLQTSRSADFLPSRECSVTQEQTSNSTKMLSKQKTSRELTDDSDLTLEGGVFSHVGFCGLFLLCDFSKSIFFKKNT